MLVSFPSWGISGLIGHLKHTKTLRSTINSNIHAGRSHKNITHNTAVLYCQNSVRSTMDFCLDVFRHKIMHVLLWERQPPHPAVSEQLGDHPSLDVTTAHPAFLTRPPCAHLVPGALRAHKLPSPGRVTLSFSFYLSIFKFILLLPRVISARSCGSSSPICTTRSWWPGSRGDADSFWSNRRIAEGRASRQVRGVREDLRSSGRRRSGRTRTQTSRTRPTDMRPMWVISKIRILGVRGRVPSA